MTRSWPLVWSAALVAGLVPNARSQASWIAYVAPNICCIAVDGQGDEYVVSASSATQDLNGNAAISVAKLDPNGNVLGKITFQAGRSVDPAAVAVDPSGNLWIVGAAQPDSQPTTALTGLIAELDSTATHVLYSGTLGGLDPSGTTGIGALAFDAAGNMYIAGSTTQLDFPTTAGAFTTAVPSVGAGQQLSYGFVAKLAPASQSTPPYTVAYSTLLGGQQVVAPITCAGCLPQLPNTSIWALAVDSSGAATVAGTTTAADFPLTAGAFQTALQGGNSVPNVFVTRVNAQGTGLVWSTLVGEVSYTPAPAVGGVALDSSGNVVLTGINDDPRFPIAAGAIQSQLGTPQNGAYSAGNGFVAKLNSAGTHLQFSTYYGIMSGTATPRLKLDAQGDIWLTETLAETTGLVLHPGSLALGTNAIAELAPDGSSVLFSELVPNGMAGQDLALNPDGSLSVAGPSGYVLRQPRSAPGGVSILGVADSAAFTVTNTISPGEFLSIYGNGLGPAVGADMQIDASGLITRSLGGTEVTFNGIPAPLLYAAENQINALVPYEVASSAQVTMSIATGSGASQTLPLQTVAEQPTIMAVLNSDGSLNSSTNPATVGSTETILLSGVGALNASLPDGTIAGSPAPAAALAVQVDFTFVIFEGFSSGVGTRTATPTYAGGIPGWPINVLEVKVPVPDVVQSGPPPFGVYVKVGDSASPTISFYVAAGQ